MSFLKDILSGYGGANEGSVDSNSAATAYRAIVLLLASSIREQGVGASVISSGKDRVALLRAAHKLSHNKRPTCHVERDVDAIAIESESSEVVIRVLADGDIHLTGLSKNYCVNFLIDSFWDLQVANGRDKVVQSSMRM